MTIRVSPFLFSFPRHNMSTVHPVGGGCAPGGAGSSSTTPKKAAFTGFRQSRPMNEGLAMLNPYLSTQVEDREEDKRLNFLQR